MSLRIDKKLCASISIPKWGNKLTEIFYYFFWFVNKNKLLYSWKC